MSVGEQAVDGRGDGGETSANKGLSTLNYQQNNWQYSASLTGWGTL